MSEEIKPGTDYQVVSNHMGPNGESIDRIYGSPASGGQLRLINADYSQYQGTITKKSITQKSIDGSNFRSYCYVTADNRWFDRAGMPIQKPNTVEEETVDNPPADVLQ